MKPKVLSIGMNFVTFFFTVVTASALSTPNVTPIKPQRIAVTGATGRTGTLVVEQLVDRGMNVVALVRDLEKAEEKLPSSERFEVIKCDLGNEIDIIGAVEGCDAAIWCATGFSDAPDQTLVGKIANIFGVALNPKKSIDAVGVPALAKYFASTNGDGEEETLPKVIMLSSAGVTRPSWDEEKKAKFAGCADIPIVRLSPFGILDIKADSEERLRKRGK